jgi:hypothetical protein
MSNCELKKIKLIQIKIQITSEVDVGDLIVEFFSTL